MTGRDKKVSDIEQLKHQQTIQRSLAGDLLKLYEAQGKQIRMLFAMINELKRELERQHGR
jgi:hypothetical protein